MTRPSPVDAWQLGGTLVVVDAHARRQELTGTAELSLRWRGHEENQTGTVVSVDVVCGHWHLPLFRAHGTRDSFSGVELRSFAVGRRYYRPTDRVVPLDTPIELTATEFPATRLKVIAADTSKELEAIDVVGDAGLLASFYEHPGAAAASHSLALRAPSPVLLPDPRPPHVGERVVWVRAPRMAWQRIRLDDHVGGEHLVTLQRGGDVLLFVRGLGPKEPAWIRLYTGPDAHQSSRLAEFSVKVGRQTLLTGLSPGEYEARLEVGVWPRQLKVRACRSLAVVAGEEARLDFDLEAPNGR